MRIYSRLNANAIDDPEFGHFEVSKEHGGFDLPDELAERQLPVCLRGKRAWETELERDERLHGEESARRRDPESLYNAVEQIANLTARLAGAQAPDEAANAQVSELSKQVAALTAKLEAMEASAPDAGNDAAAKTSATRSKTGTAKG